MISSETYLVLIIESLHRIISLITAAFQKLQAILCEMVNFFNIMF